MKVRGKILRSAVYALAALMLGAVGASANVALEVEGGVRGVAASGRLTFAGTELSESTRIVCDVTLLRSIERTIRKVASYPFAKVNGVAIGRGESRSERSPGCSHGSLFREVRDIVPLAETRRSGTHRELGSGVLLYDVAGGRAELWKVIYDSFQGTLPEIAGINFHIEQAQYKFNVTEVFGGTAECLYKGALYGLVAIERGTASRIRVVLERTTLERQEGGGLCPARGTISGELTLSPNIRVTLSRVGGPIVQRIRAGPIEIAVGATTQTERFKNTTMVEVATPTAYPNEARYRVNATAMCAAIRPLGEECEVTIGRFEAGERGRGLIGIDYTWEGRGFRETFSVEGR